MILLWLLIYFGVLVWSAISPHDRTTWVLESFPGWIALVVLVCTFKCFRLTSLAYWLVLLHCILLFAGGHYTYAQVPLFEWAKHWFGWSRNNYDRFGHLVQGFVPAILTREVVIRKRVFSSAAWRNFFIVCFCLALSASYELFEWMMALISKEGADAFLGTQGDVWDTQEDMACALIGAICALLLLRRLHDQQLKKSRSVSAS